MKVLVFPASEKGPYSTGHFAAAPPHPLLPPKNLLLSNKCNAVVSWLTYILQAGTWPSQGQLGCQPLNYGATEALMVKSTGPRCWVSVLAVACGST